MVLQLQLQNPWIPLDSLRYPGFDSVLTRSLQIKFVWVVLRNHWSRVFAVSVALPSSCTAWNLHKNINNNNNDVGMHVHLFNNVQVWWGEWERRSFRWRSASVGRTEGSTNSTATCSSCRKMTRAKSWLGDYVDACELILSLFLLLTFLWGFSRILTEYTSEQKLCGFVGFMFALI